MTDLRWSTKHKTYMKIEDIDKFMAEIKKLCSLHNMSISHEDGHGGFLIHRFNEHDMFWLEGASDDRD